MKSILFVCLGNICRSPMAEFYFRHLVEQRGLSHSFIVASAATSNEEEGNPVYPPARRVLADHGICCDSKWARQMCKNDYQQYDFIVGMDESNVRNILRITGGDPEHKVSKLLDHIPASNSLLHGKDVADPWYTRQFNVTWDDITAGCNALLDELTTTPTF